MNLLLDTHAFLWWDSARDKLPQKVLEACESPENSLFLSVASVWEIQIKHGLGKLNLSVPLPQLVADQQRDNGLEILPVNLPHLWALGTLPTHHNDPFDCLLIAQARSENMLMVSADEKFKQYPIEIFWQ